MSYRSILVWPALLLISVAVMGSNAFAGKSGIEKAAKGYCKVKVDFKDKYCGDKYTKKGKCEILSITVKNTITGTTQTFLTHGANTEVTVDGESGEFHTSCSKPICVGDTSGNLELIAIEHADPAAYEAKWGPCPDDGGVIEGGIIEGGIIEGGGGGLPAPPANGSGACYTDLEVKGWICLGDDQPSNQVVRDGALLVPAGVMATVAGVQVADGAGLLEVEKAGSDKEKWKLPKYSSGLINKFEIKWYGNQCGKLTLKLDREELIDAARGDSRPAELVLDLMLGDGSTAVSSTIAVFESDWYKLDGKHWRLKTKGGPCGWLAQQAMSCGGDNCVIPASYWTRLVTDPASIADLLSCWPIDPTEPVGGACGYSFEDVLTTPPAGDAWLLIAKYYAVAALNIAYGAEAPPDVMDAMGALGALLEQCQLSIFDYLGFQTEIELLDGFNFGIAGPDVCPGFDPGGVIE